MSWYCYILKSDVCNKTYIGYTNNLEQRLRQHNGEITGGAKYTHQSRPWSFVAYLTGFPNRINCLSCEWALKRPKGLNKRLSNIATLLNQEKWTSKCIDCNQNQQFVLYVKNEYIHLIQHLPSNVTLNTF